MKQSKKIAVILISILLLTAVLVSCKQETNGALSGNISDNMIIPPAENLIYSKNYKPVIICNEESKYSELLSEIQYCVYSTTYASPPIYTDSDQESTREIVFGKSEREVSKVAYKYLERLNREEGDISYLIYSDGSSVAIAFDEDIYGINAAATKAVDSIEKIFNGDDEIIIPKGTVAYNSFNALEYQEEIDAVKTEEQWKIFIQKANELGGDGEAIAAAVKDYYKMVCTDNVISWWANLYDPAVGGYYFSNSARNTEGFLPDIETTQQAIGQFESSGMFDDIDGNGAPGGYGKYMNGLPEWFRTQVVRFLKSLQDPETGFFYHPQWTKEEVNQHLSRRARDLNRAVGILHYFNSAPTYDTPNGDIGDGVLWSDYTGTETTPSPTHLTGRLIYASTETLAVSKVVPTAEAAIPSHMMSVSTFKAYLAEQLALNKAGKRSFYSIGNEIGSQVSQIQTRDKQLDPSGQTQPLGDVLIAWYTENQNPTTGLWDAGLTYDNTNAILKIGGTYTDFGYLFPNADLAFESCVQLLTTDEEPDAIVEVYNVWYAISNLMINVDKCATSEADRNYANEVRLKLLEMAPEAIILSARKQLAFKHEDGSIGYTVGQNCVTSQGMRVAPPGDGEGDVNATVIGMGGTIGNCLKALGLDGYQPGYFTKADRLKYLSILENLGPVIKNDVDVPIDYEDFDNEDVGNAPTNVEMKNQVGGSILVVDRVGGERGDHALEFDHKDGYETFNINSQSGALTASCFIFETDMMVKDAVYSTAAGDETTIIQLLMQPGVYMIAVKIDSNGNVKLMESSSNSWKNAKEQDIGVSAEMGEWFKLKIMYFIGDHDTVRIKVFFNNGLVAVTDNYYDSEGIKLTGIGTPKDVMDYVTITGLSSSTAVIDFDNMACYKTMDTYKRVPASGKQPAINIDPPDREQIIYDFDDGNIPEDFTVSGAQDRVVAESGALKVSGDAENPAKIILPINIRFGSAKCVVLDTDIIVGVGASGTIGRIYFTENAENKTPLACFDIAVVEIDGVDYTVLVEAPDGKPGAQISGTAIKLGGAFNLRMEYYEAEKTTLIYINGNLVNFSGSTCKNAEKYTARTLVVTSVAGASFDMTFDNFIFEKDVLEFKNTTTSEDYPRVEHSFDVLPNGATVTGNTDVKDGALVIGNPGDSFILPLNDRNVVTSAVISSFKITSDGYYASYIFTILDAAGTDIISFMVDVSENSIEIYEYYSGKRGIRLCTVELREASFTIDFKYYYKESVMNIFVNGNGVAATSVTDLYDRDYLTPTAIKIRKTAGVGIFKITECYAERAIELYSKITTAAADTPEIENTLTFESSSYENYPKVVTHALGTGSRLAIKAMMVGGVPSKTLAFTTTTGNNDSVYFSLQDSNKVNGATVLVYEADMLFDIAAGAPNAGVEIYFRKGSNYNARYILYFDESNTNNRLGDWWLSAGGKDKPLGVKENERFKIRFEYTVTDGTVVANIFVNGNYLGSCTRDGADIAVEEMDRIVFYTQGAMNGTVYFDNVKFYQTKELTPITANTP